MTCYPKPERPDDHERHLARIKQAFAAGRVAVSCSSAPPLQLGEPVLELARMRAGIVTAISGDRVTILTRGHAVVCACDAVIRRAPRRPEEIRHGR